MSANEEQVGGKHYKGQKVEHWDFVLMHNIPYLEAQIIKYVMRHKKKNGMEDLMKAEHFLAKLIETSYPARLGEGQLGAGRAGQAAHNPSLAQEIMRKEGTIAWAGPQGERRKYSLPEGQYLVRERRVAPEGGRVSERKNPSCHHCLGHGCWYCDPESFPYPH